MRLALFAGLLAVTILVSTFLLPVGRPDLPVPSGQPPSPATGPRCLALTYARVRRPEILPHTLKLLPDAIGWILGRRTYRAIGDGDPEWKDAYWAYAGPDSIDVTTHDQAILRLPRQDGSASGRGEPYLDGTLFFALYAPGQGRFIVFTRNVPCSGTSLGGAA